MTQPSGADGPGEHGQAQDTQAEDTQAEDTQAEDTQAEDTQAEDTQAEDTGRADSPPDDTAHDYGPRAETYLRLLAESELRRALARPRSPVQRIPPTAVLWAANAVGTLTGTAQLAARSAAPAAAWAGQGALRFLAPPARQAGRALPPSVRRARAALAPPASQLTAALAPRAGRATRAVRQAGWQARIAADRLGDRLSDRLTGRSRGDDEASENALERVQEVAHVLVAAGVLSEAVARAVGLSFGYALASRGLADDFSTWDDWPHRPHNFGPPATAAGPILVAGIGAQAELAADGYRARTHLLALVLAPGTAQLTTVSWLTESPPGSPEEDKDPGWQFDDGLGGLVQGINGQATDNRGGTYQLHMSGGGGSSDGPWEARLELSPEPPAGLDWLEIRLTPDQDPVRVDLTKAARVDAGPQTARPSASPVQRGERIIDAASERLLGGVCPDPEHEHEHDLTGVVGLAGALRAAGVLPEDSPALARLRTLIRRMRLTVPAELTGPADAADDEAAELPEAWLAVLSPRRWAGLSGDASAATAVAVLPELDGVRCVIAGLMTSTHRHSVTHSTTMQVLAWGWPWHAGRYELWQPFTWWARDDAGRWYQGAEESYSSGGDLAEIQIALSPALHPEATSLELILSGASGQVSATVPVTWARMP